MTERGKSCESVLPWTTANVCRVIYPRLSPRSRISRFPGWSNPSSPRWLRPEQRRQAPSGLSVQQRAGPDTRACGVETPPRPRFVGKPNMGRCPLRTCAGADTADTEKSRSGPVFFSGESCVTTAHVRGKANTLMMCSLRGWRHGGVIILLQSDDGSESHLLVPLGGQNERNLQTRRPWRCAWPGSVQIGGRRPTFQGRISRGWEPCAGAQHWASGAVDRVGPAASPR